MTKPVYKIETLTGAVLDHTITEEGCLIHTKEILTDNIGIFSFSLPAKKADYQYYDIVAGDIAKIYLGYGTVPATPTFIGKIFTPVGVMDDSGFNRTFAGRSKATCCKTDLKLNGGKPRQLQQSSPNWLTTWVWESAK